MSHGYYRQENVAIVRRALRRLGVARTVRDLLAVKLNQHAEPAVAHGGPLHVCVEVTTYCNLKCPTCAHPTGPFPAAHMDLARFRLVLDRLGHAPKLTLVGLGEALMNRELPEMVRLARERGSFVGLFTNGTLLRGPLASELLAAAPDFLRVSLDGATRDTFEARRRGADFAAVCQNVAGFVVAARASRAATRLEVWFTATRENFAEVPAMVDLAHALGVSRLVVTDAHSWNDAALRAALARAPLDVRGADAPVVAAATAAARRLGLELYLQAGAPEARRSCDWPWLSTNITVDGSVTPCCLQAYNPAEASLGNLVRQPDFAAIWRGPRYVEFRRRLRGPVPPAVCAGCPAYARTLARLA
jgi:MoaA/NifB/PqqE/SkfB family radical SAM enzyme